jgi:hypothetical protein
MAKSPEILQLAEFLTYLTIMLCKIQQLNTGLLLSVTCCCVKYVQLVTLVLVPSYLRIDANRIVSKILDLYTR